MENWWGEGKMGKLIGRVGVGKRKNLIGWEWRKVVIVVLE